MKTEKKILIAFILNLSFSIVELIGGICTGSIAILSDATHDFGDAISIGASLAFEKKSKIQPDEKYTYGYARYSVLGGAITSFILLIGSGVVIYNAVLRFFSPVTINYDGMLILAVVGFFVNALATFFTHGGHSINQKAVNLHMLEDALGWLIILIGAVVMRFTDFYILDPILSILVAVFIVFGSIKNLKEIVEVFLLKKPASVDLEQLKNHLLDIDGVEDVHHFHVWSMDGERVYGSIHVAVKEYDASVKSAVKEEMKEHGIEHITVEMERVDENCDEMRCVVRASEHHGCNHHHHH